MATNLILDKDLNGNCSYGLPITPASQKYRINLSAATAASLTIPAGMTRAFFSFSNGIDVHVEFKTATAATVPSGSFSQTTCELNPVERYGLNPGDTMSFISDTTGYVYVTFFPAIDGN